uniref:hypothetical protein n=1 Tax=Gemmiger formicilis TaxID=745368 RepID=UPI003FED7DFA
FRRCFQDREVISCSEKQYKGRCPQGQRPFLVRPYVIKHIAPRLCTLHKRGAIILQEKSNKKPKTY